MHTCQHKYIHTCSQSGGSITVKELAGVVTWKVVEVALVVLVFIGHTDLSSLVIQIFIGHLICLHVS